MKTFKEFIKEHLTPREQSYVDAKKLDTSEGKRISVNVVPKGQTHVEVPISNPLDLRIKEHLNNNPVTNRAGEHLGYYKQDAADPSKVIHPDGRKMKLSGVLKSNPELAKEYSEVGSRATKVSSDYDVKNHQGETRWTAPALNPEEHTAFISYHPHALFNKSHRTPWNSCASWDGQAGACLENDVKRGGAAAYLVSKGEANPDNPVTAEGRIAINTYHAWKDGKIIHTIWRASEKRYGRDDAFESFHKSIINHLKEKHPMIHPEYHLDEDVYNDDNPDVIKKPLSSVERANHIKSLNDKIENSRVEYADIKHAIANQYLSPKHIHDIANDKHEISLHDELATAHRLGNIKLPNAAINAIAKNPESHYAHYEIAAAKHEGTEIPDEALLHIAKNPESHYAHEKMVYSHLYSKPMSSDIVDAITKSPKSLDAHNLLARIHAKSGKVLSDEQVDNIANNPNSNEAHEHLVIGLRKKHITMSDKAINAIANNDKSDGAHDWLASAHKSGAGPDGTGATMLPKEAVNKLKERGYNVG